ncbi:MAG: hypothetical protein KBT12_08665 [Bacteroidales bacterium]|nr:hypothetical protein [Candidatus Physcousia equi]
MRKLLDEASSNASSCAEGANPLLAYLDGLSHAQFRTACQSLGDHLLPSLPNDAFWQVAQQLVSWNRKAFLVTVMKRVGEERIDMSDEQGSCASFFRSLVSQTEDVRKLSTLLIPKLSHPAPIRWMFRMMEVADAQQRIALLMQSGATQAATYFALLGFLREVEHDRQQLLLVARTLVQRGDAKSWNMASLLRSYFGLTELRGTFSLRVENYELSALATDFTAFSKKIS